MLNEYKSNDELEDDLQNKGLNAPRLTEGQIDQVIMDVDYHVFPHTLMTVCCLTLENGFTVAGFSACASPENFNAEVGRKIAFGNAKNQIWALEGYLLKQKLYDEEGISGGDSPGST